MGPKKTVRRLRKPRQIAAIDLGSTSIRMTIAEVETDRSLTILDELIHPVSLGTDTFTSGRIGPATMRAACQVLKNFNAAIAGYNVEHIRCVATSAIREAQNKDIVIDRIRHESGIRVEVLDAVEESRLTYQILRPFLENHFQNTDEYALFLDLGGGSTETMLLRGSDLVFASNRRLGTARLFHSIAKADCEDRARLRESIIRNVVDSTISQYTASSIRQCIVVNSLLLKALESCSQCTAFDDGIRIPQETVHRIVREVDALSEEDLAERFSLTAAEVDLLPPAMHSIARFLERIDATDIHIVELELVQGILHELVLSMHGESPLLLFGEQILHSARGLGQKFHYDAKHNNQVAKLSITLYDQLADFLDLSGKDRLYLQVAAILHDIGMFVSERAHHKHSKYLIEWSELVGLNQNERNLVAIIARYHRKAHPRPTHPEYTQLPLEDRLRVTKLASLLRIADALDRGHLQVIHALHAAIHDNTLRLSATTESDLIVEQAALKSKGRLFRETTGLSINLVREQ